MLKGVYWQGCARMDFLFNGRAGERHVFDLQVSGPQPPPAEVRLSHALRLRPRKGQSAFIIKH